MLGVGNWREEIEAAKEADLVLQSVRSIRVLAMEATKVKFSEK